MVTKWSFFQVLQATHGASAVLPKALTNVLNSQACHGKLSFHYLWQSPNNPSTNLYLRQFNKDPPTVGQSSGGKQFFLKPASPQNQSKYHLLLNWLALKILIRIFIFCLADYLHELWYLKGSYDAVHINTI